ncbi:MAG TPA: metal ABC transporter permease [Acidimicrobiales bacterium]|nr:metal ABC transporter permease [Acidimicrobiales bacterium]
MFAPFMLHAWAVATVVAVVAGVAGFFTVLRGSAFAAHALPNGAFAGAAAATLAGVDPLVGLGAASLAGVAAIAGLGRRARSDVATALAIVVLLATGDLLLGRTADYAEGVYGLLFGEVLGVSTTQLVPTAALAAAAVAAIVVLYRPLLLASVIPDAAEAHGIRAGRLDLAFLVVLALVTTAAVPVVGSLLVFSLLIGPPAAAQALTARPARALALSVALALTTVWASVALAYVTDLPIGFYVGTGSGLAYAAGRLRAGAGHRRRRVR